MRKTIFIALGVAFLFFGISSYMQSRPAPKNKRVYDIVQEYNPYYLDKRFGGLTILNKNDKEFKEKPSNMDVFHRIEALGKKWASSHLKLENSTLFIKDNNSSAITKIPLNGSEEINFVHNYYGI